MECHQWGILLEIIGFIVIAFCVGIILVYKSELGMEPFLDKRKDLLNRILDRIKFLRWFKSNNAVTVSLVIIGTVIYFIGTLLQAIHAW